MAFEQKELCGSLFQNDRKEEGTKQRDYNGEAKINGVEYWVSGWKKPTKDGKRAWLSLSFTKKEPPNHSYPDQQKDW
jgi:hypothetical protein